MSMPGFNAALSLYDTNEQYRPNSIRYVSGNRREIRVAQVASFDPCARCLHLVDPCARARCACICAGGDVIPVSRLISRCGFLCA
jgi:hypothetical protein